MAAGERRGEHLVHRVRHAALTPVRVRLYELLRAVVGSAHRPGKPCLVASCEPIPHGWLLPGLKVLCAPMGLDQLDLLTAHALKRRAASVLKRSARQPRRVDGKLGADDTPLRLCYLAPESAQKLLRSTLELAGAVRVARIEEESPSIEWCTLLEHGVERLLQLCIIRLVVAPQQLVAPRPGSKAQRRYAHALADAELWRLLPWEGEVREIQRQAHCEDPTLSRPTPIVDL